MTLYMHWHFNLIILHKGYWFNLCDVVDHVYDHVDLDWDSGIERSTEHM